MAQSGGTSAGFINGKTLEAHGRSDSLGLAAHSGDTEIIRCCLAGMESMVYVVQDLDENLERRRGRGLK